MDIVENLNFDLIVNKTTQVLNILNQIITAALERPYAQEMLLGVLICFVLLVAIRAIRRSLRPIKLFDNRVGVVEVSKKALDELVQSVCYSLGALNRPDVKIFVKRGRLSMRVSLKLESGQKLTDASAEIQTALTSAFREHLGVEKLGTIDVKVLGFKGLIYKPTTKFLPPVEDVSSDDTEILSDDRPIFDTFDDQKK